MQCLKTSVLCFLPRYHHEALYKEGVSPVEDSLPSHISYIYNLKSHYEELSQPEHQSTFVYFRRIFRNTLACAMAITILNCLSQALPAYPYNGPKHVPHPVGSTVQMIFPPKFAIHRSRTGYDRWAQIGLQYLTRGNSIGNTTDIQSARSYTNMLLPQCHHSLRPDLQADLQAADALLLGHECIPEREDNIRHTNEADIVRTANLYLTHPVIQALGSHPRYRKTLVSQSEHVRQGTRTDITFKKLCPIQSAGNQVHRDFFILEFKRRGMMDVDDFQQRVPVPPNTDPQSFYRGILEPVAPGRKPTQSQKAAAQAIPSQTVASPVLNRTQPTTFKAGPMKLLTQAAAYAVHHSTRYVALFNYDCLVCCYFPWVDPTRDSDANKRLNLELAGEYPVEVDVYPGNSPDVRLTLLGIMWTAVEEIP